MKLSNATPSGVLRSYGMGGYGVAATGVPDIGMLVAELRIMLMRNIDSSIKYGAVAAAIKSSVSVYTTSATSAVIRCDTVRPSIYASVGLGGAADIAAVYNYGSTLGKNAYFFKEGVGGFYLKDREGFRVHDAGHFLEKTASEFMGRHPECTVSVI